VLSRTPGESDLGDEVVDAAQAVLAPKDHAFFFALAFVQGAVAFCACALRSSGHPGPTRLGALLPDLAAQFERGVPH
jgi:hypothetical protein